MRQTSIFPLAFADAQSVLTVFGSDSHDFCLKFHCQNIGGVRGGTATPAEVQEAEPPELFISERAALAPCHGPQTQPECIQLDEALRIELVIGALIILKRHMLHGIEAIGRLPPSDDGIALIKLEPHGA